MRWRSWTVASAIAVLTVSGCTSVSESASDCPVTVPPAVPYVPPAPWPESPGSPDWAWFGSDDLWTVVATDGWVQRKSIWWSADFPGGAVEEAPPLEVCYTRLDGDADVVTFPSPGTNAFTGDDQWFMINGIEPDEPGCWRGTATYKGASLSYVFWLS